MASSSLGAAYPGGHKECLRHHREAKRKETLPISTADHLKAMASATHLEESQHAMRFRSCG
jgi:hypothetical protein